MPQGLQVRNAEGKLILDVRDRLTRVLGVVSASTTRGDFTDPQLATGTPWYAMYITENPALLSSYLTVGIVDTTISWAFFPTGGIDSYLTGMFPNYSTKIIYGVF